MNPFHCKLKVLFFFYGSVASHKVYVHFLSAIVSQWASGMVLHLTYCKLSCYKYKITTLSQLPASTKTSATANIL